jgi:hypothetical protein
VRLIFLKNRRLACYPSYIYICNLLKLKNMLDLRDLKGAIKQIVQEKGLQEEKI